MGGKRRGELPAELARARERFEVWRRTRRPKARIPEPLWALAAELVPAHGLHRTASTLRLDYYGLKKRVAAMAMPPRSAGAAFVEWPTTVALGRECVLEFEDAASGTRLRVALKGYDAREVAEVSRSFRERL